jgi:hypothetical protein
MLAHLLNFKASTYYDCRYIANIMAFVSYNRYYNPSRAAPDLLKTTTVSESRSASNYAIPFNSSSSSYYAIFTSVVIMSSANLPIPPTEALSKNVSGILCTQEWERFCVFFCMIFKSNPLGANITEDAISFSTRLKPKETKFPG